MKRKGIFLLPALAVFLLLFSSYAAAKPFYEGKPIVLVVSTNPGGGYDFYGRMVAVFMEKELPGSTIIVKNVPGAGHVIGWNEIYNSKPNGLTFGTGSAAIITPQLLGMKGVKYDLLKMSWLGHVGIQETFIMANPAKYKSWEQIKKADRVLMATSGKGSTMYTNFSIFIKTTDSKNIKLVTGFSGSAQELALMRGDIDGIQVSKGDALSMIKKGTGAPVLSFSNRKAKEEVFKDVPLFKEIVPEQKWRKLVNFVSDTGSALLARIFGGPPGIPADRLKILRDAFARAIDNPEFVKRMEKAEMSADHLSLEEFETALKDLMDLAPEDVEILREATGIK